MVQGRVRTGIIAGCEQDGLLVEPKLSTARGARRGEKSGLVQSAQQAAEKAIKAVYQRFGGDAWGHSCFQLLRGLLEERGIEGSEHLDGARLLDRFYVPARYPNGWEAGTPKDMITERDADDAIRAAEEILRFCKDLLARPPTGP